MSDAAFKRCLKLGQKGENDFGKYFRSLNCQVFPPPNKIFSFYDLLMVMPDGNQSIMAEVKTQNYDYCVVEYRCVNKGVWYDSGIATTSSQLWCERVKNLQTEEYQYYITTTEIVKQSIKDGLYRQERFAGEYQHRTKVYEFDRQTYLALFKEVLIPKEM